MEKGSYSTFNEIDQFAPSSNELAQSRTTISVPYNPSITSIGSAVLRFGFVLFETNFFTTNVIKLMTIGVLGRKPRILKKCFKLADRKEKPSLNLCQLKMRIMKTIELLQI